MNYRYYDLLNLKCSYKYVIIIFMVLLFIIIFLSSVYKLYDTYEIRGIYNSGSIIINVPIENVNFFSASEFVVVENKKYSFKLLKYGDIYSDTIIYQEIVISLHKECAENEVINMIFHKNEERIIYKIWELLL